MFNLWTCWSRSLLRNSFFVPRDRLTHTLDCSQKNPEEVLSQGNKFVIFRKGAVSIFIVAALLRQKHCAVTVFTNRANVLPQDMLDNNWWNNVRNCMGRLSDSTANRKNRSPQAASLLISFLSLLLSFPFLLVGFSTSLVLCIFMYG